MAAARFLRELIRRDRVHPDTQDSSTTLPGPPISLTNQRQAVRHRLEHDVAARLR